MGEEWVPRSERKGGLRVRAEFPSSALREALAEWADSLEDGHVVTKLIALRLDVSLRGSTEDPRSLLARCGDQEQFLDAIEGYLRCAGETEAEDLRWRLDLGGSTLTVSPDLRSLTELVSPEMEKVVSAGVDSGGGSDNMADAWTAAFGREPDPSDAWDHAIKAVEEVLIHVVVPNKAKATLGDVIGALGSQSSCWRSIYPQADKGNDVQGVVAMLRQIWPNPDRHGTTTQRTPTLDEARAVVTLAAAIVQIAHTGGLVEKRSQ